MPDAPPGGLLSILAFLAGGAGVSGPRERPGLPVTEPLLITYFLRDAGRVPVSSAVRAAAGRLYSCARLPVDSLRHPLLDVQKRKLLELLLREERVEVAGKGGLRALRAVGDLDPARRRRERQVSPAVEREK